MIELVKGHDLCKHAWIKMNQIIDAVNTLAPGLSIIEHMHEPVLVGLINRRPGQEYHILFKDKLNEVITRVNHLTQEKEI